ncbi:hypothetical protein T484DRAFT_2829768 [Baffinella frigidus]|nr:hypothetical protein T484DRAFT_2829768 [Cryptophyta sp. CCMP2293]
MAKRGIDMLSLREAGGVHTPRRLPLSLLAAASPLATTCPHCEQSCLGGLSCKWRGGLMASASAEQPLRSWVPSIATPRGSATPRTGHLTPRTPRTPAGPAVAGTPRQLAQAALAGEALAGTPLVKAFGMAAERENISEGVRPPKTRVATSKRAMFGRDAKRHANQGRGARGARKAAPEAASMQVDGAPDPASALPPDQLSSPHPPARKRLRLAPPQRTAAPLGLRRHATPRGAGAGAPSAQTAFSWVQPIGASCLVCGGVLAETEGGEGGEVVFRCTKCHIVARVAH